MSLIIFYYFLPARPPPDEEPPEGLGLAVLEPPVLPLGRGAGCDTLLPLGFGELFTVGEPAGEDLLGFAVGDAVRFPFAVFVAAFEPVVVDLVAVVTFPPVLGVSDFDFGFGCTAPPVADAGFGAAAFAVPDAYVTPLFEIGDPVFPRNDFPPPKGVVVPGVGTLSFIFPPALSEPGIRPYLTGCPVQVVPT